jgi:hypothetical protein
MRDTSLEFQKYVAARYAQLTPSERVALGTAMFDAARTLFESNLPANLGEYERKRRITAHFYGQEFADRVFPVSSTEGR